MDNFCVLSGTLIEKILFLDSLSIQCKIRCNRPSDTLRSTGWWDQPAGHPWSCSVLKLHFFWL